MPYLKSCHCGLQNVQWSSKSLLLHGQPGIGCVTSMMQAQIDSNIAFPAITSQSFCC